MDLLEELLKELDVRAWQYVNSLAQLRGILYPIESRDHQRDYQKGGKYEHGDTIAYTDTAHALQQPVRALANVLTRSAELRRGDPTPSQIRMINMQCRHIKRQHAEDNFLPGMMDEIVKFFPQETEDQDRPAR